MKTILRSLSTVLFLAGALSSYGQDQMKTLFGSNAIRTSGGYGALTNKLTRIGGSYANLGGVYGGWYINHKIMIGVAGAAVTNNIPVPDQYSATPGVKMSYEYGQCGLMTEYILGSNRAVHLNFQLFSGAGFTTQYERYNWDSDHHHDDFDSRNSKDTHWFTVVEPGVNLELNVFKWMRISSGISYRAAFGSDAPGLKDSDINGATINTSLKFGKF